MDLSIVGILCDAQSTLELCRIISSVGSVGGLEERERERERERSVLFCENLGLDLCALE